MYNAHSNCHVNKSRFFLLLAKLKKFSKILGLTFKKSGNPIKIKYNYIPRNGPVPFWAGGSRYTFEIAISIPKFSSKNGKVTGHVTIKIKTFVKK